MRGLPTRAGRDRPLRHTSRSRPVALWDLVLAPGRSPVNSWLGSTTGVGHPIGTELACERASNSSLSKSRSSTTARFVEFPRETAQCARRNVPTMRRRVRQKAPRCCLQLPQLCLRQQKHHAPRFHENPEDLHLALPREVALRRVQPEADPAEQSGFVPPDRLSVHLRCWHARACGRRGPEYIFQVRVDSVGARR
jgi:hypothetical protein